MTPALTRLHGHVSAGRGPGSLLTGSAAADNALAADTLAACVTPGATLVVGVTGSVAAGKTTFCSAVADRLKRDLKVEVVSTDGFLLPNDMLMERGLVMRKGFPESYDTALLAGVLRRARWGPVSVPGYSHTTYDRAPDLDRMIDRPDMLIVEGLGFSAGGGCRSADALLDLLVYLDAGEDDLETWYVRRFMQFWREAETNPASFYVRFRTMDETQAEVFARHIWTSINLPNLREHIAPMKDRADILVAKSADHAMRISLPAFARA